MRLLATALNYRQAISRLGDRLAYRIGILVFFHQEVGNVKESIVLQAMVHKG